MATDDFEVDSLAAYLHLLPAQVLRLTERGKLPGRRVAGQWRFSRAEIHHWLEQRIGLSDQDELVQMEDMLERTAPATADRPIALADLLSIEAIEIPLKARTRSSVIKNMAELAARSGLLWDADKMADAIRIREDMQPTALDIGVALLHPRRPMPRILEQSFVALGITSAGIPFGGGRGTLTDVFFLIGADSDQIHLRILARISRLIADADMLAELRAAADAATLHQHIAEWDERVS